MNLKVVSLRFHYSQSFFQLNSGIYEKPKLSDTALLSLESLNWADYALYEEMNRRLDIEKEKIGPTKVWLGNIRFRNYSFKKTPETSIFRT